MSGIPAANPSIVERSTPDGGGTRLPPSMTIDMLTADPTKAPQTVMSVFFRIGFIRNLSVKLTKF
jgi:hypothetical protein